MTENKGEASILDNTIIGHSFDEYYKEQLDAIASLQRLHSNLSKDSVSRKSTLIYYKKRMENLNLQQELFIARHQTMVRLSEDGEHEYFKNFLFSEYENLVLDYTIDLTKEKEALYQKLTGEPSPSDASNITSLQQQQQSRIADFSLRLPQIEIPKFSGNYVEWNDFYNTFNRLIHTNIQLTSVEKFNHLKGSLPIDFDADILGLDLTENNYTIAWNRLVERYNNKRVLFAHYLNKVVSMPSIGEESATEIKTLKNNSNVCYTGLSQIGLEGDDFGKILVYMISAKLPKITHQQWESHLGPDKSIPSFQKFVDFLDNRFRTLESWELFKASKPKSNNNSNVNKSTSQTKSFRTNHAQVKPSSSNSNKFSKSSKSSFNKSNQNHKQDSCTLCKECHNIRSCPKFLSQDCFARKDTADRMKLCVNCLNNSHTVSSCTSKYNCSICGKRHHTLLHFPITQHNNGSSSEKEISTNHSQIIQPNNITFENIPQPLEVLLPTAIVLVRLEDGTKRPLRALLDQGSTGTLIAKRVVSTYKLPQYKFNSDIKLPTGEKSIGESITNLTIVSRFDENFEMPIVACVVKKPTENLPMKSIKNLKFRHFDNLDLADPDYMLSRPIDILIGSDIYSKAISGEIVRGNENEPIAQNTKFGWIISGSVFDSKRQFTSSHIECNHVAIDMNTILQNFFKTEGITKKSEKSDEEIWCENFLSNTHIRQSNGKYLMRLPLKSFFDPNITIGKSRHIALRRFLSLERKLESNPDIKSQYHKAIQEYFDLQQIEEVTSREIDCVKFDPLNNRPSQTCSYLPHHAVIKPSRLTTKCRVVFDASAKTSNGRSLNEALCIGPKILNDLSSVLTNWRFHKYVFTADIEKMYRCIDVNKEDAQYQRILWRFDPKDEIKEYFLNTVTFGLSSAPCTAIFTTHLLADHEAKRYPLAQPIIKKEMYVDDVNSGGDSIELTKTKMEQVRLALHSGGFELRKWASNCPELLENIPIEHHCVDPNKLWDEDGQIKTLGMCWHPNTDTFHYQLKIDESSEIFTKRRIASQIARIYDPLGLINPIIVTAKIFLSEIWKLKINWDDKIPIEMDQQWRKFLKSLDDISNISIPRWVNFYSDSKRIELHIFCDGSIHVYAASIYVRIKTSDNQFHTHLLSTKSSTVPSTVKGSTPRIELLAAGLAIKLMSWAKTNLSTKIDQKYFWSDSSCVLCWIRGNVEKSPIFVRNRIALIHKNSEICDWYHIDTHSNPADIPSRGASPIQLRKSELYWHGPEFLKLPQCQWPKQPNFKNNSSENTEDVSIIQSNHAISNFEPKLLDLTVVMETCKSFKDLCRKIGWFIRWKNIIKNPLLKSLPYLTLSEVRASHDGLIRLLQKTHFSEELKVLKKKESLSNNHPLANLAPFLDKNDIMRVLGRLAHAPLSYDEKHPIIIPKKSNITQCIIDDAHKATLHGGFKLTFSTIRNKYWIVNASVTIRNRISKCIPCKKANPQIAQQQMGNLPASRFLCVSPFTIVGIDYTGPFSLRASRFRGNTTYKGYVILFICLNTKAVHLDVTSGMSIDDFFAAFQRFISRKGTPKEIHSDNGPNFVGSNKKLQKEFNSYKEAIQSIMPQFHDHHIDWQFIPPYSPNFGGLWESNIKSMKRHLKFALTSSSFTYEEFTTVLARVECALNSRPLTTITSELNDVEILTPGHFLTGKSLLVPPEPIIEDISPSKRYWMIQRAYQQFWRNWSKEWLNQMQLRQKWKKPQENLKVGDIVMIKDDNMVTNKWSMGKVVDVHAGSDGLVRVASLKTGSGISKRAISKLCKLPLDQENTNTEKTTKNDPNSSREIDSHK